MARGFVRTRNLSYLVLLGFLLPNSACYGDADKFQFWPSAGVAWEVNKDWTLDYTEEFRLNDNGGTLYYGHSDIGVIYKSLAEWLDIGFNYREVYGAGKNSSDTDEHRTSLSAIMRGKILDRDFSDRIKIDYRDRDEKKDIWRFRNKFTLDRQFEFLDPRGTRIISKGIAKPYVSDEIFVNLDGSGFSENRINIGAVIRLTENTSIDFYYSLQTIKDNDKWGNNNILGLDFTYNF